MDKIKEDIINEIKRMEKENIGICKSTEYRMGKVSGILKGCCIAGMIDNDEMMKLLDEILEEFF